MRDDPYNERSGQDRSSQIGASTKLGTLLVLFSADGRVRFPMSAWPRTGSVLPASWRGRAPVTRPSSSTPISNQAAPFIAAVGETDDRFDEFAVRERRRFFSL